MPDYKDTLNLPQTDFPMKANLAQREPTLLKRWSDNDLYGQLRELRQQAEKFILHDGPPYANGNIHLGHAVNKILKDMIIKSQSLNGFDVPYVPGWDCHGLPIEVNVEKKIGKPGVKVSTSEFRQACRDYSASQVDKQREDFKRLGVFAEWDKPYLSMNQSFEANVIRALRTIIAKGHLQQGFKPVYWCFDCQSSLAEAEVEYQEKKSPSIDVKFRVKQSDIINKKFAVEKPGKGDISVVIWTTTPWTLPANRAVALHPDLDYALIQLDDEQIIIAHDRVSEVMARYDIAHYKVLGLCKGHELEGLHLQHPLYARDSLIILGDHVTIDTGTGAVHTAPSHGEDDYRVGQHYDLPLDTIVQANGVFNEDTELFNGQFVFKANQAIIEALHQANNLLHQDQIQHSYPHCWRHKTPVIFRATPQWFISMEKQHLGKHALQSIQAVQWYPAWGEQRMQTMLEGRPDWCISRQRTWGVPLPLLVHKDTNQLHPEHLTILGKVADLVEEKGIDIWFDMDIADLVEDAEHYRKITDVLDVWFDSGVTHYCVLQARDYLQTPANVYLEGSDQYRGWFQTSLLTSVAMSQQAPYKQLITHGFTVDAQGRKMSKSLGNVIAPEKVIKTLGADVLRLWVASTDYTNEMVVSDEILKRTSDIYRRIRNTVRFLLANLKGFDYQQDCVASSDMLALDRWVVDRAHHRQQAIIAAYDDYQFLSVVQNIQHFCSIELGSFYLDVIKDRQYTCPAKSVARRSTQTAMYHIVQALVRWIAPILCFTADEIWQYMPNAEGSSVHLSTWYNGLFDADDGIDWDLLIQVRDAVNKQLENRRSEGELGSALEAEVQLYAAPALKQLLDSLQDELRFLLITSEARVFDVAQQTADAIAVDKLDLAISIQASKHKKCERCWHRRADTDQSADYPGLCQRCVDNISGDGEIRRFV